MGVKLSNKLKRIYIFLNYNLALNKTAVFTLPQAQCVRACHDASCTKNARQHCASRFCVWATFLR